MGNVGLLCEDSAGWLIRDWILPPYGGQDDVACIGLETYHRIVRETGVLMAEDSPEAAHSLLGEIVSEFLVRNTPVLERRERVRDIGTGNANAGAVGRGQSEGLCRPRAWILRLRATPSAQDDTTVYWRASAPHHRVYLELLCRGENMHVVQVRACAKAVHNLADFIFGLGDDGKPHVVFVGADVVMRNGRDFVDHGGELIKGGVVCRASRDHRYLARTES